MMTFAFRPVLVMTASTAALAACASIQIETTAPAAQASAQEQVSSDIDGFFNDYDAAVLAMSPQTKAYRGIRDDDYGLWNDRSAEADDARAYIARIEGIAPLMDALIDRAAERAGNGVMPPDWVYPDVLSDIENLLAAMDERLPDFFITLPEYELQIKPVEAFRERSAGKAFYQSPAPDGSHPGTYYVNLYNLRDMRRNELEALAYHEASPGHHMQRAIQTGLSDLPPFRRFGGFTAYTEGWGLYSEELGKDMGFYTDPYSDFGRLGMKLRERAREQLGERFDIREFHEVVLTNGPVPLDILEEQVDAWIASELS